MSLQLAANHLSAQGRGPDSTLVHMSPREVNSLQGLAMAHGGSLTINPETGLPEAGFLSSILPMVAGAALMATGVGAPMAAMMVGGGMTVATGSLQKGIVAGLGAYGGAGLAGGLMGAGAGAAASATAPGAEVLDAALAGSGGAGAGAAGAGAETALAGTTELSPKVLDAAMANQSAMGMAQTPPGLSAAYPGVDAIGAPMNSTQPYVAGLGEVSPSLAQSLTPTAPTAPAAQAGLAPTTSSSSTLGEGFSKMGRGVEALGTSQGQDAFMKSVGGAKGLMQTGLAAAAPMMTPSTPKPYVPDSRRVNYRFDPGRIEDPEAGYSGDPTGQRRYFNPTYTRLAGGGPVEDMSLSNVYDMQNARGGVSDMGIDNSTGMQRMARGGITNMADGGYSYDPDTQTYSGSAPSGGFNSGISGLIGRVLNGADADRVSYQYDPITKTYARLDAPEVAVAEPIMHGLDAGAGMGGGMDGGYGGGMDGGVGGVGGGMSGADGIGGGEAGGGYGGGDAGGGGDGSYARGGLSHLGDYSDGGRLLRGPGDGVSDSIPAMIGKKRPARLADGEFVVPARIVSELGNGSTEAGARKLYAMMDRVQRARGKTTGKNKVAKNTRADKYLPA